MSRQEHFFNRDQYRISATRNHRPHFPKPTVFGNEDNLQHTQEREPASAGWNYGLSYGFGMAAALCFVGAYYLPYGSPGEIFLGLLGGAGTVASGTCLAQAVTRRDFLEEFQDWRRVNFGRRGNGRVIAGDIEQQVESPNRLAIEFASLAPNSEYAEAARYFFRTLDAEHNNAFDIVASSGSYFLRHDRVNLPDAMAARRDFFCRNLIKKDYGTRGKIDDSRLSQAIFINWIGHCIDSPEKMFTQVDSDAIAKINALSAADKKTIREAITVRLRDIRSVMSREENADVSCVIASCSKLTKTSSEVEANEGVGAPLQPASAQVSVNDNLVTTSQEEIRIDVKDEEFRESSDSEEEKESSESEEEKSSNLAAIIQRGSNLKKLILNKGKPTTNISKGR